MKDVEFVKRVIALIDEEDVQYIVKMVSKYGFSVQGFSNPYKAPKRAIIGCLTGGNRRKKENYEILLENISTCDCLDETNKYIEMLLSWNKDERPKEELVETLLRLEDEKKIGEEVALNEKAKLEESAINEQKIEALMSENVELRDRVKSLKSTLRSKKIEIDNIKKQYEKLLKEYSKSEMEKTKTLDLLHQKEELIQKQVNMINEKEKVIVDYQEQIEDLKKYKENAPKIACFVKSKEIFKFEGYDMDIFKDWNTDIKQQIENKNYDEIWYVHKKFPYVFYMEIKELFKCNIREFRTIEQLEIEIQGGNRDESR